MPFRQLCKATDLHGRPGRQCAPGNALRCLGRFARKVLTALVLVSTLLTMPAFSSEELVGLRVGRHEIETLLVHKRSGRFWLPLKETGSFLSLRVVNGGSNGMQLATPLGLVDVPSSAIYSANATKYLDQRFLETSLNARIKFAEDDGFIVADLPWAPGARIKMPGATETTKELIPEAVPPRAGISTLHGDVSYRFDHNRSGSFEGYFRATGHAYGGVWQVNYEEDLLTRHRIRDAIWMKQLDDNRFVQIGHQTISVHPLLQSVEMTGIQYAWTNAKTVRSGAGITAGALLGRRVEHQRTFEGKGPVGGRAELWLDDRLYAQTPIGLSGTFRFSSVHLPARQSRVELRVFDRDNATTPIKVIRKSLNLSDLLLRGGQFSVVTGAGYGGNAFDRVSRGWSGRYEDFRTSSGRNRFAAFAVGRYALSDRLTAESGVVVTDDTPRVMLGAVARVSENAVGSGSVSYDDKTGLSYLAELNWRKADWQIVARSYRRQHKETALLSSSSNDNDDRYDPDWDHFLELAYAARSDLTVGLIARAQPEADFILPFARWRPIQHMFIDARPDQYGLYRIDGRYRINDKDTVTATYYGGDGSVAYTRDLGQGRWVTAELQRSRDDIWRAGLRLSGGELFNYDVNWNIGGFIGDNSDYWIYGGIRRRVRPGVQIYANANYATTEHRYFRNDVSTDWRLRIGLTFDLALTQGKLVAAPSHGVDVEYGAVAGRVKTDGATGGQDLSGLTVNVNGRAVGRTKKDGSYYLPRVPTGVHLVEFDDEGLPIEQVATKSSVVAKVVPGAVTNVTFRTLAEYGVAGQVLTGAGQPVVQATVVVFDAASKEVSRTETDAFGYYRVDGLRRGRYRVVRLSDNGRQGAARAFSLTNNFIFDINLKEK
jgi:Carboxypeptidase regulatory-like domain